MVDPRFESWHLQSPLWWLTCPDPQNITSVKIPCDTWLEIGLEHPRLLPIWKGSDKSYEEDGHPSQGVTPCQNREGGMVTSQCFGLVWAALCALQLSLHLVAMSKAVTTIAENGK